MLGFVSDHLNAAKNFQFVTRYVLIDIRLKKKYVIKLIQKKQNIKYKIQKMCDNAVNTSPSAIRFVPECYKTKK